LTGVLVKKCLIPTRAAYFEMCLIKGPHDWKSRTVEELEEDGDCNWSVCK